MPLNDIIETVNRRMMQSHAAVAQYSYDTDLSPAERAALDSVASEMRGRPILDIGVGGGRTVTALRAVSEDYLGIDYASPMVDAVSRRHPNVRFRHADARDLAFLADGSIALAMFSCNGIGMVSHEDRLAILREVRRILVPGGVFLFSTHNLNRTDEDGVARFRFPELELSLNPARAFVRSARFARRTALRLYNRWRLAKHSYRSATYSIVNDVCHDYGVMLYHITLAEQRRQLEDAGYCKDAVAYDLAGRVINTDTTDNSVMLVARTPAKP